MRLAARRACACACRGCTCAADARAVATPQRKAQYKSAIWWHSAAQEAAARGAIAALEAKHGFVIATDLAPAQEWHDAEDYHQKFYAKQKTKNSGFYGSR